MRDDIRVCSRARGALIPGCYRCHEVELKINFQKVKLNLIQCNVSFSHSYETYTKTKYVIVIASVCRFEFQMIKVQFDIITLLSIYVELCLFELLNIVLCFIEL